MAGRKFICLLLILITAYIGLMYDGPVPGILLAIELLLFAADFVLSFFLKKGAQISVSQTDSVVDSGEKARIMVTLRNRGWLPVGDALLEVNVSNCLDDEYDEYELNLRAPARSQVRVPFTFSSSYCGVVRAEFGSLRVYDYLRLFSRRKKVSAVCECVIMPRLHEMQLAITEACRSFDSDSEEFDKNRSGDDPSEIFQIRAYRQGDKMSHVHWKMSARMDEMMVKEHSLPVSNSVGLYLDLRFNSIEEAQSVFELCYSLSMALLDQECQHRIYWCGQQQPLKFEEICIRTPEDITEGMGKLLTAGRRQEGLYWNEFKNAHPQLAVHRMICITCMDKNRDMGEFLAYDQINKTVLTLDDIQDLIEI